MAFRNVTDALGREASSIICDAAEQHIARLVGSSRDLTDEH